MARNAHSVYLCTCMDPSRCGVSRCEATEGMSSTIADIGGKEKSRDVVGGMRKMRKVYESKTRARRASPTLFLNVILLTLYSIVTFQLVCIPYPMVKHIHV